MRKIIVNKRLQSSIVQSIKALDRKFPEWKTRETHETKKYSVEYLGSHSGITEYYVTDKTTGIRYLAEWSHSHIDAPRNWGWTLLEARKE
jgi:hypothetical protein